MITRARAPQVDGSDAADAWATPDDRRKRYREIIRLVFTATADLYYAHWGEFFHLAVFDADGGATDFAAAFAATHRRYFDDIGGAHAARILDLAAGGGAFAEWMADRAAGEVVGVDISAAQLAHARRRLQGRARPNLRFLEADIMHLEALPEPPFDAAVCLDAACYLPDKPRALQAIATRLRSGARFLLVDWCRSAHPTSLQQELILEPFYRYWGIPEMETVAGYERALDAAGFELREMQDLSQRVRPNWDRGYEAAQQALERTVSPLELVQIAASAVRHGSEAVRVLKEQFYAALFARAAADAGLLRYVHFLAQRR